MRPYARSSSVARAANRFIAAGLAEDDPSARTAFATTARSAAGGPRRHRCPKARASSGCGEGVGLCKSSRPAEPVSFSLPPFRPEPRPRAHKSKASRKARRKSGPQHIKLARGCVEATVGRRRSARRMNTNIVLKRGAANWVGIVAWRSSLLRAVWGREISSCRRLTCGASLRASGSLRDSLSRWRPPSAPLRLRSRVSRRGQTSSDSP